MKIFVTQKIPAAGLEKLSAAGHEVIVSEADGALPKAELVAKLRQLDPDAVLCLLTDTIDDEVLAAAPRARIFANYAVGFDNIDLEAAKRRNIVVTNTPDVLTEAVAEHAAALILALGRRVVEADRFMREHRYTGWDPLLLLGMEFKGKTLGVAGTGRIGKRTAEIMHHGFGMNVAYFDRQPNQAFEAELTATFMPDIGSLLATADVISIHLPLTDDTRHLIDTAALASMKPTALLINTARGPIVDEAALAAALQAGTIAGAALDVFEHEPEADPALLPLQNVILTPHIASATHEARDRMSIMAADNILAVLAGSAPLSPVAVVQ